MTTRYQKRHYEDVARLLKREREAAVMGAAAVACVMLSFADLFAADNPAWCLHCNQPEGTEEVCHTPNEEHEIEGGFDRECFLAACGLDDAR